MRLFIFLITFFCSLPAFCQRVVIFNGNKITLLDNDTVSIFDRRTNGECVIYGPGRPIKINGAEIHQAYSGMEEPPEYKHPRKPSTKLSTLIFDSLKSELQLLNDGEYTLEINNPVISKDGELVYYQFGGIKKAPANKPETRNEQGETRTFLYIEMTPEDTSIPAAIKAMIDKKTLALLEHIPTMSSGTDRYNKEVNTTGILFAPGVAIIVKKHKATLNDPYYFSL